MSIAGAKTTGIIKAPPPPPPSPSQVNNQQHPELEFKEEHELVSSYGSHYKRSRSGGRHDVLAQFLVLSAKKRATTIQRRKRWFDVCCFHWQFVVSLTSSGSVHHCNLEGRRWMNKLIYCVWIRILYSNIQCYWPIARDFQPSEIRTLFCPFDTEGLILPSRSASTSKTSKLVITTVCWQNPPF